MGVTFTKMTADEETLSVTTISDYEDGEELRNSLSEQWIINDLNAQIIEDIIEMQNDLEFDEVDTDLDEPEEEPACIS